MKRLLLASAAVAAASAMAIAPAQAQKTYNMKIGMVTINDSNHFSAKKAEKIHRGKIRRSHQSRRFPGSPARQGSAPD